MEDTNPIGVNLIGPGGLDPGATVPQCLDNQYVSDSIFDYMVANNVGYSDPEVKRMREADAKNEFIRSLVYSYQIVVNRAFINNNEFLYQHYLPENREDLKAFAYLMNSHAIVPYLFQEHSFTDNFTFEVHERGSDAAKALFDETGGNVTCVRLAIDDKENKEKTNALPFKFKSYLLSLAVMEEEQLNNMSDELLGPGHNSLEHAEWEGFKETIDNLSQYALKNRKDLSRNTVYRDLFVVGDNSEDKEKNVVKGLFRTPQGDDRFMFEMKKLVDLRYNTALPDLLNRYSFTPAGLPSRIALQDFDQGVDLTDTANSDSDVFLDESLKYFTQIQRSFMAEYHKGMNLPLLKDLSVADVKAIRQLDEWTAFTDGQRKVLESISSSPNPSGLFNLLEDFQDRFDAFQGALSNWYNVTYKQKKTEGRYANYITILLNIAGKSLMYGTQLFDNPLLKMGGKAVADGISELSKNASFKGYAAKLLVNVIDLEKMKLDKDRSYSMDIIKTSKVYTGEDVRDILERFKEIEGDPVDYSEKGADQGKAD